MSERARGRALWIITAFTTLLVVLGIVIPALIGPTNQATRIALFGPSAAKLAPILNEIANETRADITIIDVGRLSRLDSDLAQSKIDVGLILTDNSATALVQQSLSPAIESLFQAGLDAAHQARVLTSLGVSPADITNSRRPVPLVTDALNPTPANQSARDVAAIAAAVLLWVSIGIYGGLIANGVAQEKTSRTAELLLSAVRPRDLLAGKVLGIGACGLGQMFVTVGAGLIANGVVHRTEIPSTVWALLPAVLLWFLLGYALYAFAFAAAGALVARQEEVQLVTTPFAVLLIFGYLLSYAAVASPNAPWLRVLSFFPPVAPMLMPARIALGHAAPWETPVAVLIMVVSILAVSRVAGTVYAAGLTRSGPRLSWTSALRRRGEVAVGLDSVQ